jgi:hypothetical protein
LKTLEAGAGKQNLTVILTLVSVHTLSVIASDGAAGARQSRHISCGDGLPRALRSLAMTG